MSLVLGLLRSRQLGADGGTNLVSAQTASAGTSSDRGA